MTADAPLTTAVLALHVEPIVVRNMFEWLDLDPRKIPAREHDRRHVRRSDERVTLVFGPAGLKRVCADGLVSQFFRAGFYYSGCQLAVKPAAYTKKEEVWSIRHDWLPRVHEGRPKWEERGKRKYKMSVELGFTKDISLMRKPPARIDRLLVDRTWKRGRVSLIRGSDDTKRALIELVQPRPAHGLKIIRELTFDAQRGFESLIVINSP